MSEELKFIPVTHDELPVKKTLTINGKNYGFEFRYNDQFDFYTMYIYDAAGSLLYTTKLCHLTSAIHAVRDGLDFTVNIIPIIPDDVVKSHPEINHIGKDNFDKMRLVLA